MQTCRDRPGYTLASGTSVRLPSPGDPLGREDLLAVASAGGLREGARIDSISLAAPLDAAELAEAAPQLLQSRTNVFWAPGAKAVAGRQQRFIGAIVLEVCLSILWVLRVSGVGFTGKVHHLNLKGLVCQAVKLCEALDIPHSAKNLLYA